NHVVHPVGNAWVQGFSKRCIHGSMPLRPFGGVPWGKVFVIDAGAPFEPVQIRHQIIKPYRSCHCCSFLFVVFLVVASYRCRPHQLVLIGGVLPLCFQDAVVPICGHVFNPALRFLCTMVVLHSDGFRPCDDCSTTVYESSSHREHTVTRPVNFFANHCSFYV